MTISNTKTPDQSNKRDHKRFTTSITSEAILMQTHWDSFAQITLFDSSTIIGQILNISKSGIALQVAYQFDILAPLPITLTLSKRNEEDDFFAFKMFKLRGDIVRSKRINKDFSLTAIKFDKVDSATQRKINELMRSITNQLQADT